MDTIPLRDAVRTLRTEIMAVAEDASTQAVRFEVSSIEMEFQVVAKKEIGGEARLGFHIFAAEAMLDGTGRGAGERTQKVKFMLNPTSVDMKGQRHKIEIGRENEPEQGQSPKHTLERP